MVDGPGPDGGRAPIGARQRAVAALAVAIVAVAGIVVAVVAGRGDDDVSLTAASSTSTSSTTSSSSSTSTSTSTTVATVVTTTTVRTTTTTDRAPEPACVDAGGGPAQVASKWEETWETEPALNDPMTMRICVDDATPAVGQTVTLHLTADDPDATIYQGDCGWVVTWESDNGNNCRDTPVRGEVPRPTPAEEPGHVDQTFTHVYRATGSLDIDVEVISGPVVAERQPYASSAEAILPVTVHR